MYSARTCLLLARHCTSYDTDRDTQICDRLPYQKRLHLSSHLHKTLHLQKTLQLLRTTSPETHRTMQHTPPAHVTIMSMSLSILSPPPSYPCSNAKNPSHKMSRPHAPPLPHPPDTFHSESEVLSTTRLFQLPSSSPFSSMHTLRFRRLSPTSFLPITMPPPHLNPPSSFQQSSIFHPPTSSTPPAYRSSPTISLLSYPSSPTVPLFSNLPRPEFPSQQPPSLPPSSLSNRYTTEPLPIRPSTPSSTVRAYLHPFASHVHIRTAYSISSSHGCITSPAKIPYR